MHAESLQIPRLHANGAVNPTSDGQPEGIVPLLLSVSKVTRALIGLELAAIGLHQGQDELLMILAEEEAVPVSVLAERLCVRPSTVSKMLDRLVAKRFVERIPCERDARLTLVRATEAGAAMKADITAAWRRIETGFSSKLTGDDVGDMMIQLRSIDATLKARLGRLR